MKDIELLSPAGDFECLKAAIQNGANAVYFGADKFNARANGKNFNKEELIKAIEYAKLRNVKTHLTVNILIQNNEFSSAIQLVKEAYEAGIDAVIVQDLGLAKNIADMFPELEVHASTQMTTYNLEGVKQLERMGLNRAVIARELSIEEIQNICEGSNIDIEIFIHGALCICYSGQCLMSSMIGGRSGNRGTCAGSCRLPYTLLKDDKVVDKGYLLSSKDVCTLDILPKILSTGVKSLKIEGRMKSPEYVGLVTSIYRKYIDLAVSNKPYIVEKEDREKLMQIFNRGGFSTGYLNGKLGKEMMYINRPNHIGIELGNVLSYNKNKGYVKVKLNREIELGDSIFINDSSCKISELMVENNNIKIINSGQVATIGRIYGDIKPGNIVYKTVCNKLNKEIQTTYSKENIKRKIFGEIILKKKESIILKIKDKKTEIFIEVKSESTVQEAENIGITEERIKDQLMKTGNTIFEFENIDVNMDKDIMVPISSINEIRRNALEQLENKLITKLKRESSVNSEEYIIEKPNKEKVKGKIEISLYLNCINKEIDYIKLKNRDVDNVYIPFELFLDQNNKTIIDKISKTFNTYIAFPSITKSNYDKIIKKEITQIINSEIRGVVISNISQFKYIDGIKNKEFEIIANYTLNIFNDYTINELKRLGFNKIIISPELNKQNIKNLSDSLCKEMIVYGRTLMMTSEYCTIGSFKKCTELCNKGNYVLKDRLGFKFPIYTNKINCNNLIYNSKITSIQWADLDIQSIRIDILDESEEEILNIIEKHANNQKLEGQDYTNGNLNKII